MGPRNRQALVGLAVIAAIALLLVLRCSVSSDRSDAKVDEAHAAIVRALRGDERAFDEAERLLASAAGLTDPYPLFALEAARRLRERRWGDAPAEVRAVFVELDARRWDAAVAAAEKVPSALQGGEELLRLVKALRAAR